MTYHSKNSEKKDSVNIGLHLRALRKVKGLTLKQLADKANISYGYLWKLEKNYGNHHANPSIGMVERLSNALDLMPSALTQEQENEVDGNNRDITYIFMKRFKLLPEDLKKKIFEIMKILEVKD